MVNKSKINLYDQIIYKIYLNKLNTCNVKSTKMMSNT